MREETGLVCAAPEPDAVAPESSRREGTHDGRPPVLTETYVTNRFTILPEWRRNYAPGVTENLEHLLYLELPGTCRVTLNDKEHVGYRWMGHGRIDPQGYILDQSGRPQAAARDDRPSQPIAAPAEE